MELDENRNIILNGDIESFKRFAKKIGVDHVSHNAHYNDLVDMIVERLQKEGLNLEDYKKNV